VPRNESRGDVPPHRGLTEPASPESWLPRRRELDRQEANQKLDDDRGHDGIAEVGDDLLHASPRGPSRTTKKARSVTEPLTTLV
jgi:hypothetical protein